MFSSKKTITRHKTATIGMVVVLFISLVVYFASESILRRAMLKPIKREKVDFTKVLDWLPQKTREELKYRATYLDLRQKYDLSKTKEEKLQNAYKLAVHTKDMNEHNELMLPFINDPQYADLPGLYLAYGRMLYDPKNPKAISFKRYYSYLNTLKDPLELFYAWREGRDRLGKLGLPNAHVINVEFLKPLLDKPLSFFIIRDYSSMLDNIKQNAKRISTDAAKRIANKRELPRDTELVGSMMQLSLDAEKLQNQVNASLDNYSVNDYRNLLALRDKFEKAAPGKPKLDAAFELVRHTKDPGERGTIIKNLLKNPEYAKNPQMLKIYAQIAGDIGRKNAVPLADFHKFILTFQDPANQYQGFLEALRRQNSFHADSEKKMALLRPLLKKELKEIPFKDYHGMYDQISRCAVYLNDQPAFEKSIQLRDALRNGDKPTLKEYLEAKKNTK